MEGFEYPKKPESEHRFTEFLRTRKEIDELRRTLHEVGSLPGESEAEVVYIEEHVTAPNAPKKTTLELKLELEEKLRRYEEVRSILADEANPKE